MKSREERYDKGAEARARMTCFPEKTGLDMGGALKNSGGRCSETAGKTAKIERDRSKPVEWNTSIFRIRGAWYIPIRRLCVISRLRG